MLIELPAIFIPLGIYLAYILWVRHEYDNGWAGEPTRAERERRDQARADLRWHYDRMSPAMQERWRQTTPDD